MNKSDLKAIALKGEDRRLQFKLDVRNVDALAAEMVAFSNSEGGRILIGVSDAGELEGLPRTEISRINQLISNAASQHVRSPISPLTENISVASGRGVNAPGVPEIPPLVIEELLVNAMVHRDYLVSAPIRIFIFDNRIEIISPGHLPDNLTVEKIRLGNSIIRNPILVSYAAKGILPYRGLGSGIKRALDAWPGIDFVDDRDGCLFTAAVHRKEMASSEKSSEKILSLLKTEPELAAREIGRRIGVSSRAVEKQIANLRREGRLRRIGPPKGGRWEVL